MTKCFHSDPACADCLAWRRGIVEGLAARQDDAFQREDWLREQLDRVRRERKRIVREALLLLPADDTSEGAE